MERATVNPTERPLPEWADIPGNELSKRAIEVALAGGHGIVLLYQDGAKAQDLIRRAAAMARVAGITFDGLAFPVCACGNYGSLGSLCTCSAAKLRKHYAKLAKLLPQFDMMVECLKPSERDYRYKGEAEAAVMARVMRAVGVTRTRKLSQSSLRLLELADSDIGNLDIERTLRVAGTIAALDGCTDVLQPQHVAEAIQYWRSVRQAIQTSAEPPTVRETVGTEKRCFIGLCKDDDGRYVQGTRRRMTLAEALKRTVGVDLSRKPCVVRVPAEELDAEGYPVKGDTSNGFQSQSAAVSAG